MRPRNWRLRILQSAGVALLLTLSLLIPNLLTPAWGDSQVRIVRLSEVGGGVEIDRNNGQRYEKAFLNLPVTLGAKLRTQSDGRAEIEFENNSTLRLTPNTLITFHELSLLSSGGKVSAVEVKAGTAYINFVGGRDDLLQVAFGDKNIRLTGSAHLRLEVGDASANLAVFKGNVEVKDASGSFAVAKNHTALFDLEAGGRHRLVSSVEDDPYDGWDKQQDQYHQRYTASSGASYSPYAYGNADLSYYGSFFNTPQYGMMWQPYFVGAGWDPFMEGAWAFDSGSGFGWVSAYPWGWTPYHYGTWIDLPGYGWAWQPGGTWMASGVMPRVANLPHNFAAPRPPSSGQATVVVSRTPLPSLERKTSSKLLIRNNSAGLGIPRGSVRNMEGAAHSVGQSGVAAAKLYTFVVPAGISRDSMSGREVVAHPAVQMEFSPVEATSSSQPISSSSPTMSSHSGAPAHR
jgi:hypothetical protein